MKKGILITEDEKKSILNLYGLIKEEVIQNWAQIDITSKVSTDYTSNLNNYPSCIKQMGKPIRVTGVPFSSYTVKGTGDVANFLFFPYRYTFYNADPSNTYVEKIEDDTPMAYDKTTKQSPKYSCTSDNRVKIGDKIYNLTSSPQACPPGQVFDETIKKCTLSPVTVTAQRITPTTGEELLKGGILMMGDRGELVKQIQKLLANSGEGYAEQFRSETKPGKTPFDGIFGRTTYSVVKEYQKDNLLPQTGKIGKLTWEKLRNTRIRFDWDIKTGQFKPIDSGVQMDTVARREIGQIPTADKTIVPLTPSQSVES